MVGGGVLMIALIQGGRLSRPILLGCVVIGMVALAALVYRERHAQAPMLPIRLWRNRVIALDNGGNFAIGMVMMSVTAFLPLYVQGVMGRSATATGAVLGTQSISWALSSLTAGRLSGRGSTTSGTLDHGQRRPTPLVGPSAARGPTPTGSGSATRGQSFQSRSSA